MRSNRSSVAETQAAIDLSSPMSVRTKRARSPRSLAAACPVSSVRAAMTTDAPASTNPRAIAEPSSELPPVTTATVPASSATRRQLCEHLVDGRDPLHVEGERAEAGGVELLVRGCAGVRRHDDLEPGVRGVTRRVLDGRMRRDAGDDEASSPQRREHDVEIGPEEGVDAGVRHDELAATRLQPLVELGAPRALGAGAGPHRSAELRRVLDDAGVAAPERDPDGDDRDAVAARAVEQPARVPDQPRPLPIAADARADPPLGVDDVVLEVEREQGVHAG